jgi:hypothetical protein
MAAPVTRTSIEAVASVDAPISPGKSWITKGGISHIKGEVSEGTLSGDISGDILMIGDETFNLKTGKGTLHTKWIITMSSGTFEGTLVGFMTATGLTTYHFSGTFTGCGTGAYKGQKLKGSFAADGTMNEYPLIISLEGIVLSKG